MQHQRPRILIGLAAGGTGGHVFAAQAVAEQLYALGIESVLFTDHRGQRWINQDTPWRVEVIETTMPPRGSRQSRASLAGFGAVIGATIKIWKSVRTAAKLMKSNPVDAMVGFGGYPSFPACFAARTKGIPLIIHEQNGVMGRANRVLARWADAVTLGFENCLYRDQVPQELLQVIGNPVRSVVLDAQADYVDLEPNERFMLLVSGGSQGAVKLVSLVIEAIQRMDSGLRARLKVCCQCPHDMVDATRTKLQLAGTEAEVFPFFADLPQKISQSHLVISRGGASTITELAILKRPAMVIPLPGAIDGDQERNGTWLANSGAAICVNQQDMTSANLSFMISDLMMKPEHLSAMSTSAAHSMPSDAAATLARLAIELVNNKRKGSGQRPKSAMRLVLEGGALAWKIHRGG